VSEMMILEFLSISLIIGFHNYSQCVNYEEYSKQMT